MSNLFVSIIVSSSRLKKLALWNCLPLLLIPAWCNGGHAQAPAAAAPATAYLTLPQNPNGLTPQEQGELRNRVLRVLRGEEPLSANQKDFDDYFIGIEFPPFTLPQNLAKLPERRVKTWKTQILANAHDPAAHDRVNQLALKTFSEVAGGNYHPVARYNAMLMVAELNATEKEGKTPAVPMPEALPVMLRAVAAGPVVIDSVQVAALMGIQRQADPSLSPERQADVRKVVLELYKEDHPKNNRTPEGHDWMRRRCADILGALGSPDGPTLAAFEHVIHDASQSLALRCTTARALGRINFSTAQKLNLPDLTSDLGALAVECYRRELSEAKQQDVYPSRQRLKGYMSEIIQAFKGPEDFKKAKAAEENEAADRRRGGLMTYDAAPQPQKQFVTGTIQRLEALSAACDPTVTDADLEAAITKAGVDLESWLQSGRAATGQPAKTAAGQPANAGALDALNGLGAPPAAPK